MGTFSYNHGSRLEEERDEEINSQSTVIRIVIEAQAVYSQKVKGSGNTEIKLEAVRNALQRKYCVR